MKKTLTFLEEREQEIDARLNNLGFRNVRDFVPGFVINYNHTRNGAITPNYTSHYSMILGYLEKDYISIFYRPKDEYLFREAVKLKRELKKRNIPIKEYPSLESLTDYILRYKLY
jgi:hypothetical protein